MVTNVYIIEDYLIMRMALCDYLNQLPDLYVCGYASTAQTALVQLATVKADIVLVDSHLPGLNGIDLVSELQRRFQDLPCIMLSGYEEWHHIRRAFAAGARGYIVKGNPAEIPEGIQQVLAGNTYLSRQLHYS